MEPSKTRYLDRFNGTLNDNLLLISEGARITEYASNAAKKYFSTNNPFVGYLVATITCVALAIFTYQAGQLFLTTTAAALTIYTGKKLIALLGEKKDLSAKLKKQEKSVNECYNNLIAYINRYKKEKEEYIEQNLKLNVINSIPMTNESFPKLFAEMAKAHKSFATFSSTTIEKIRKQKSQTPPKMIQDVWTKFMEACDDYITCNQLYNRLATQYAVTAVSLLT